MAEASNLVQTISKNFLECAICFEPLQDPRALPCQHGFCRDCLEQCLQASEDKHSLVCPTCRKVVTIPKGVEDLPVHFLVSSLQETVDIMQKEVPKPSKDTPCSNCNDPAKLAKVRCLDCKRYLCDTCHASHETLKTIMKDHRVVSMEDILSGKVSLSREDEDKCATHGEVYKYYCETEEIPICQDCVILKKCPTEHDRITLEKAAKNLSDDLDELLKKCSKTLKKYPEAIQATRNVKSELEIHKQLADETLARLKEDYICKLEEMIKKHENEINRIHVERTNVLDGKESNLESTMKGIQKATEDTRQMISSCSKCEIISTHQSLSRQLQELSQSQPVAADKALGYIKFEAATQVIPSIGKLSTGKEGMLGQRWKLIGQFSTGEFNKLYGLDINKDGYVLLASWDKGVKVFSRDGEVRCTLYDSPGAADVAVTPDNKYVTNPLGKAEIQINDSQGNQLSSIPVTNVNNETSKINSVAVNEKGRIIVGQVANTISIHNADGSLISRFATQRKPRRLAVTSNGEIVSSFLDSENKQGKDVQLMDYTGCNVRIIRPPTEVKSWYPSSICCRQGEIFVVNSRSGNPPGIYRYTARGDYLGCVTTEVIRPTGIALSHDGQELFAAEHDSVVEIFKRP